MFDRVKERQAVRRPEGDGAGDDNDCLVGRYCGDNTIFHS